MLSVAASIADVQAGSKLLENRGRESLGEDIGILGFCRYKEYMDMIKSNMISNKVQVNLHTFGMLVLNRIVGEVDSTFVVTVNYNA